MLKGTHHTDEAKARIKLARERQDSFLIGRYGITRESYDEAIRKGLRWCRDCKKFLPPQWFYGKDPRCIDCIKQHVKEFRERRTYQRTKEDAAYYKRWRKDNEKQVRRRWLLKYGVSVEWYDAKLAEQKNGCAICGAPPRPPRKYLCIDHSHKTGKVRGLLCIRCNAFVSGFDDGMKDATVAYLAKYQ